MAIDVQRIRLDISKQPTQQVVRLGQGDANGTTLECAIYDEGQAYSLTGKTVLLRIQLPGGYAEYHVGGTVSGNVATFPVDEAYAASVAGTTNNAYVEVLEGGTAVCSTSRFRVVVLPSAYEGTDPAHIWDNGVNAFLQSATAQVRELTDDAERAISDAQAQQAAAAAELDAALDALGDISEVAVPLMSTTTRGGAMLGSGLTVSDGRLRTNLVESASGSTNVPMTASGDLLHGLTVQGRSVQDGTPTPNAPVPVQSVEGSIDIVVRGVNSLPITITIPLQGNVLASMPDGTHDELTVDALGLVKLVKRVGAITFNGSESEKWGVQSNGNRIAMQSNWPWTSEQYPKPNASASATSNVYCNAFAASSPSALANGGIGIAINNASYTNSFAPLLFGDGSGSMTVEAWMTWLQTNPINVYYPLATPTTIDLGTIEPPKLADGATVEVVASLSTPTEADWWALGAGAVGDGLLLLRDMIGGA